MTRDPHDRSSWRVLPLEVAPPLVLLERGLALLDDMAEHPRPTLRWYRSTHTAVVLGRGQQLPPGAARTSTTVEVHVRHSGGGAVLLDPSMLSLDVVVPPEHPLLAGDLTAVFDRVGAAWLRALTDLGVPDLTMHSGAGTAHRRGSEREQLLAAVCYATLGRGEVLAGRRKLVGLAQRRRRHGALVQCGLLRRWSPGALLSVLGADPEDAEIHGAAVGLDDLGLEHLTDDTVIPAVSTALVAG